MVINQIFVVLMPHTYLKSIAFNILLLKLFLKLLKEFFSSQHLFMIHWQPLFKLLGVPNSKNYLSV